MTKSLKKTLLILLLLIIVVLAGYYYSQSRNQSMENGKVLRVLNGKTPDSLDPQMSFGDWDWNIERNLFMGLFVPDSMGSPVKGLVKDYTVSDDKLIYTFHMRQDIKWSDGKPLTAEDVLFSFRRALTPSTGSQYSTMLKPIKNAGEILDGTKDPKELGVEKLDDYTIKITLSGVTPYFISLLSAPVAEIIPEHTVKQYGKDWIKTENMVVSGPYKITKWTPNDKVVAVKNPTYYNANNVKIDKVIFLSSDNAATEEKMYISGVADWSRNVDMSRLPSLRKKLGDEVKVYPIFVTYYYVANNNDPKMKDVRVRQALAMAINRTDITKHAMNDTVVPATAWIPPHMLNYIPAEEQPKFFWSGLTYKERLAKAKSLLKSAGYDEDNPLKITLSYNSNNLNSLIAVAARSFWKKIGVEATLETKDTHTHYADLAKGNYQLGRGSWDSSYNDPMSMLFIFGSKSPKNYAKYNSPVVDNLLESASKELDIDKRAKILAKVEKTIMTDLPYIPIYFHTTAELVSKKIIGYTPNPLQINPIWLMDLK